MDAASRPGTKHSANGLTSLNVPATPVVAPPIVTSKDDAWPANHDKRQSMQNNPLPPPPIQGQKRLEQNSSKRTGFGLFGKFKEEDDERLLQAL